jgi:hypothetical protein
MPHHLHAIIALVPPVGTGSGVRKWKSFAKQAALPTKQVEMIGRMHQVRI